MGSLGSILNPTLEFLQNGFEQVNALQGLIIALFATVLMKVWRQLFAVALGAAFAHVIVDAVLPVATQGVNVADIRLPPLMRMEFWNYAASLYVGFVMIVAMFFAVKSVVFRPRAKQGARAHS